MSGAPPETPELDAASVARQLVAWYRAGHRRLPWRETDEPYHIWLSEIMLQQTQAETVKDYYRRFLARFPNLEALANAPLDDVLKLWEGLGYYARARNLHRAAKQIATRHQGRFPRRFEDILALPGVGRTTAGAIASLAFGERRAILDGNLRRLLARLLDLDQDVTRAAAKHRLWAASEALVEAADSVAQLNQAAMELGATLCSPRSPDCDQCPVADHCQARAAGTQALRPVRPKRKATPHYDIAVAVIFHDATEKLLIQQRPAEGLLGGLWEFPGGKQEPGERLIDTVRREVAEELALEIDVGPLITTVDHAYSHFRITLSAFWCRYLGGQPHPRAAQQVRWVAPEDLDDYAFPKANRRVLEVVRDLWVRRQAERR